MRMIERTLNPYGCAPRAATGFTAGLSGHCWGKGDAADPHQDFKIHEGRHEHPDFAGQRAQGFH